MGHYIIYCSVIGNGNHFKLEWILLFKSDEFKSEWILLLEDGHNIVLRVGRANPVGAF